MEKEKFIQIGNDRLRLSNIRAYGIKPWNRYFVRNEACSEVDRLMYNTAFNTYSEAENSSNYSDPMVDVNGYPVYMDGDVVREGQLPPKAFDIEVSRALYVDSFSEERVFLYVAGRVDFDIDEKVASLDRLL